MTFPVQGATTPLQVTSLLRLRNVCTGSRKNYIITIDSFVINSNFFEPSCISGMHVKRRGFAPDCSLTFFWRVKKKIHKPINFNIT